MRTVESLLRDAGVAVPAEGLIAPIGISDDGLVVAGARWVATIDPPGQSCDVEMSQARYVDGDAVVITSLRFTNSDQIPREARLRLELTLPFMLPFGNVAPVLDLGALGGLFLPASFDRQLGPVTMFAALPPSQPRGAYQWRCALEDPHTGEILAEDFAPFELQ